MDGSSLLGARIDRLLRGDAMARMSGAQRVAVAVGCAAVLVLAIACRQQIAAEPLRPDPEVQKQIDENKARAERHQAAVAMTAADAAYRPGGAGAEGWRLGSRRETHAHPAPHRSPPQEIRHFGLRGRLAEYLLRAGERESVAAYLEQSADRFALDHDRLLQDAAHIRAGVMPLSYQYAEARR